LAIHIKNLKEMNMSKKLSTEAQDLLEDEEFISSGIESMDENNIHLVAEVMVKTYPKVARALMLELESQLKGTK